MVLKIKTKILLIFVLLVTISSVVSIAIANVAVRKNMTDDLIKRIIVNTKSELGALTNFVLIGDTSSLIDRLYDQKASHKDLAYLLVLDEAGKPIASTLINKSPDELLRYNILPKGKNENALLIEKEGEEPVYDIALRLNYDKGVLRAGYYKKQIDESTRGVIFLLAIGSSFSIVLALLFALVFTRRFFKPLDNLKDAVQEIASGDLTSRADVLSKDELGFLAQSFNEMAAQLETSYNVLEQKVTERTKELDQKVAESERMNKLMVGRELKMAELKEEIIKLKAANGV